MNILYIGQLVAACAACLARSGTTGIDLTRTNILFVFAFFLAQQIDHEATRSELERLLTTAGTDDKKKKVKEALDHIEVCIAWKAFHTCKIQ